MKKITNTIKILDLSKKMSFLGNTIKKRNAS